MQFVSFVRTFIYDTKQFSIMQGKKKKASGEHMTYASAGVDIGKLDYIKSGIIAKKLTFKREGFGAPLGGEGHYAGLIDMGYFALAITTDGVGTKLIIADIMEKWDTVGIDCVAMNVNDLYVMGVEPLAFVDYISLEKPNDRLVRDLMVGLNEGARQANISIVGGETAALPDIIKGFDLAGTAVGVVQKDRIISGSEIKPGDVIVGLPSNGVHSNGYSLVRKVIEKAGLKYTDRFPYDKKTTIGAELLKPTRIYAEVPGLCRRFNIHGMAHITGGGLYNLQRITRYGFEFSDPLPVPGIFKLIQEEGNIEDKEMYRTFNMGMGYVIICAREDAGPIVKMTDGKIVGKVAKSGCTIRGIKLW